eukprot:GFUD01019591.1.p1 GENE.GFUD01019591.1~~GFUD01019591.1.p1  ORF type:complete len:2548 (-),score=673.50 GFUD01019591.1:927-8570(-)
MGDRGELEKLADDIGLSADFILLTQPTAQLDEVLLIPEYTEAVTKLRQYVMDYFKAVTKLTRDHAVELGEEMTTTWKEKLTALQGKLLMYSRDVARRSRDLIGPAQPAPGAPAAIAAPQSALLADNSGSTSSSTDQDRLDFDRGQAAKKIKKAEAVARATVTAIKNDLLTLTGEFAKYLCWSSADDADVEKAMSKIDKWRDKFQTSKKESIQVEGTILGDDLAGLTDDLARLKLVVSKTESELDTAIADIEAADVEKGLFSNRKAKSSLVELPSFSGQASEDFVDFQTKFNKACTTNKIPKTDQVQKLREVLSGKAKAQVPDRTESMDRAWELLDSAFGDPMTLLKFRKQAMAKLGDYPDSLAKTNPQKIVEWALNFERLVDELIKLGERETRLEMEMFNDSTVNSIIDLFPVRLVFKMERLGTSGKEKLEGIIEIVEEERTVLQRMANRAASTTKKRVQFEDSPRHTATRTNNVQPYKFCLFANPKKLPDCRICKELEKRGDNTDLYDNHHGNYATHCPRWAGLNNEERRSTAMAAKLCLYCMNPKVIYHKERKHKCIMQSTKTRYHCSVQRCCLHSWVCTNHKDENKELLKNFSEELLRKNIGFTFLTTFFDTSFDAAAASTNSKVQNVIATAAKKSEKNRASIRDTRSDLSLPETIQKLQSLTPPGEQLCTKLKDPPLFMFSTIQGEKGGEFVFYDSGNSHVLFKTGTPQNLYGVMTRRGPFSMGAVGKTTVMAGDEWACQVLTAGGHREILIGLTVDHITSNFPYVNLHEATAEMKASCRDNQQLQNLHVPDQVGGEVKILLGVQHNALFPKLVHMLESGLGIYMVKLQPHSKRHTAALAGPHHSFNFLAGKVGNVSYLLKKFQEGIDYWRTSGAPAPKVISMSKEDLSLAHFVNRAEAASCGIADVETIDDDDDATAGICVTHAAVRPETEDLEIHGSPKRSELSSDTPPPAPSKKARNRVRERLPTDTRDDLLEEESSSDEAELCGWLEWMRHGEGIRPGAGQPCKPLTCTSCDLDIQLSSDEAQSFLDDLNVALQKTSSGETICIDKHQYKIMTVLSTQANTVDIPILKEFINSQLGPLNIEYRCPKCRSCGPCRNAIETEKVSLREEAEDLEIRNSVKLDFKNKRFICNLPLRGKEELFLATNRFSAEKVLDRQCKVYNTDESTRKMIVKAMKKLFDNGHVVLLKNLPKKQRDSILSMPVNYFIPWRVVFKTSLSTPARPVFDCSAKTPTRPDGSGGRCLNDIVMKGRFMSLNLIKMMLRFVTGRFALSCDIKQFYNVFKLVPEQWHLQLFLWKEDMNPDGETFIAVIKTLIYGNKASAPQSEEGMRQFANYLRPTKPRLADFLMEARFVDDLNDSEPTKEALDKLQQEAEEEFGSLSIEAKGYAKSGETPSKDISEDGTIGVGGMVWNPLIESLEVKYAPLHFGSVSRGRLTVGTQVFEGKMITLEEMNKFVPTNLTKRQIVSKFMSVFDLLGHLIPLTSRMKRDMRRMMKDTALWDEAVTNEHRTTWVKNFLDLERCKGIKYTRPRMPEDAVDSKMRLMVIVDAAQELMVVWAGVGFKRKNGKWSSAYLIGRSLLAHTNSTIPKDEMEALVAGSNMLWLLRQILSHWVDTFLLAGDAQIPLFWVLSEKKRLGLWHRTRAAQVRRGTPLENIYHVRTEENVADGPTRPDKLKLSDLGPGSVWETGLPWMAKDMEEILADGELTPATKIVLNDTEKEDYDDGFVFERTPDILTQGHLTCTANRVDLVSSRAEFSKYLLLPTKYPFKKSARILAVVSKFAEVFKKKFLKGYSSRLPKARGNNFQVYQVTSGDVPFSETENTTFNLNNSEGPSHEITDVDQEMPLTAQFCALSSYYSNGKTMAVRLSEEDLQAALGYYYETATKEVEKFNKIEVINRISVKKEGVLYRRTRILEGQRFVQAGELEGTDILRSTGINVLTPVIDRWSPLAYAIGDHVHTEVVKHGGFETCFRASHSFVHILNGLSLFRELAEDCTLCKRIQKRFVEAAFGPIHPSKFTLAPPFWTTQGDLWGPITVYVPGREKETRNSKALTTKVYAMVFVCVVTKLVNMQIVESKDTEGLCDGLTRLSCEVGTPAHFLIDQENSLMKSLREGEVDLINIQQELQRKVKVNFEVCPVAGHNWHGLVERKIWTAQLGLEKSGAGKLRLHATGAQSLVKLLENDMNNTPMGLSYGRSQTNTPLLKLISPNMMRMGRINSRNPIGPFRLPSGPSSMMDRVTDCYKLWYKEYQDTMFMKYMLDLQPKWYKSDRDTKCGDVVYFRKRDGKLDGPWTIGIVDEVVKSKDGIIRRVNVKYHNPTETEPRFTDRSVRKIVRLFNVEDGSWKEDMMKVQAKLSSVGIDVYHEEEVVDESPAAGPEAEDVDVTAASNGELEDEDVSATVGDGTIDSILATAAAAAYFSPPASISGEPVGNYVSDLLGSGQVVPDLSHDEGEVVCDCCCASHHRLVFHIGRPATVKIAPAMPPQELTLTLDDVSFDDNTDTQLDVAAAPMEEYSMYDPFLACVLALDTDLDLSKDEQVTEIFP